MSKKRDNDLKSQNRSNFEQKGPSQVSRATVEHRDVADEGADAGDTSNPVTADMLKSREQAIKTNERK